MSIFCERLYDAAVIEQFLTEPDLWKLISETNQDPADFVAVIDDNVHWVGMYDDELLYGMLVVHTITPTTAVVHINILKEYRKKYSMISALMCMKYMIHNTDYNKFNTEVPEIYPNVEKFLLQFGFKVEGRNRNSINKDNILVDQTYFGITRDELVQSLNDRLTEITGV